MPGRVYLIGAGPGDPGLLTLKGKACLEAADVVLYDRLVTAEVLAFARPDAERVYVGKEPDNHAVRQSEIHALLLEHARAGKTVARLKGGDPFVFGRGGEEAEVLAAHGIPFEVVPGVTSAVAAPAYAGIPLTYRGVASGFHVVTGRECASSAGCDWALLASAQQTLVVLMGLAQLPEIAQRLLAHGRAPDTPVAVIAAGTTPYQQVVSAPLDRVAEAVAAHGLQAPAVIVVGEVARLADRLGWFDPATAAVPQQPGATERIWTVSMPL
ncbi:MAG: uroporphyrinogen-III C-methyltransferase [Alicyclobacillus sp.]|nr:uroporphyrinogen-III C-methyltransferase [Alicyclobacillus sp.]